MLLLYIIILFKSIIINILTQCVQGYYLNKVDCVAGLSFMWLCCILFFCVIHLGLGYDLSSAI